MPAPSYQAALLDLLHLDPPPRDAAWFASVDWDAVLAYAGTSLAPLVLRGIGTRTAITPPGVVDILMARRDLMARRRLLVTAVQGDVFGALGEADVPFIVLKGAALASLVYPDPVLRPMSDIDLWVQHDRVDNALRAMETRGFHDSHLSMLQAPAARTPDEWRLVRRGAPLEVELHTRLPSIDGLPWAGFETAWQAGMDAELSGAHARVLSPEHQLTQVCLHLARKHLFTTGLSHLVDVARITARWRESFGWPGLLRQWRDQDIADWMLLTLVLARDLLGGAVPPDIEAGATGPDWQAMRALVEEQLWEGRSHRLPAAAMRTARLRSAGEVLGWLRRRLFDHYWRSPEPRTAGRVLVDGLRRIWHDATVKVPLYIRSWLRGDLRGRRLEEGRDLERRRAELERLVAASGLRGTGPDVATGTRKR